MPLQIKLIDVPEFDGLRDEWNDLLRRSACDSVFLRWEWIHTWWNIFQQNKRLFILTARNDGRLCGIAPCYIDRTGLISLRTLKFCSEELSPDYMDMIAERGQEEGVVRGLVNDILRRAGEWDLIALDNLRAESSLLSDHALFRDYACTSRVSNHCPYIQIAGTFDDYYRPRPQLVSFGLKRKLKILLEEKKVTYQIVSDEEGLSKGLGALFDLHEKRRQLMKVQSNFLSPEVRQFHQELSRHFFKEQILSLHLLCDGEAAISAIYAFNYKNKISVFQTGFDPAWKKWSAGAALLYLCVQRAYQDGLREFDFLKGTEGYKSLWATAVRDEMRLTVYNRNLRGSLYHAMDNLKTALKGIKHALD